MKKTEVYSWRISSATKTAIEHQARREQTTISALLDRITKEWLDSKRGQSDEEAEQANLRVRVSKTIGTIAGSDPARAERAKPGVRKRLKRSRGR